MVKYLRGIYNCKAFTNDVNRFNVVEKKSENNTFAPAVMVSAGIVAGVTVIAALIGYGILKNKK